MPSISIQLKGTQAVIKRMSAVAKSMGVQDIDLENLIHEAAKVIAKQAKANAPQGPTGNLKRAVIAKKYRTKRRHEPAAFAGMDYRIAPHARLIEFGTKFMSARPYFKPAVEATKGQVERMIKQGMLRLIAEASKR